MVPFSGSCCSGSVVLGPYEEQLLHCRLLRVEILQGAIAMQAMLSKIIRPLVGNDV